MRSSFRLLLPIAAALPLAPAIASSPAPVCAAPAQPPVELAGWARRAPLTAGAAADAAPALTAGSAVNVALLPVARVAFAAPLGRPPALADKGGLLAFVAPTAGTYRVALGGAGWIDMLQGATTVASTAHTHGPECTGIRKMVDFPLQAGRYTIQLSSAATDVLPMLIVRLP